MWLAHQCNKWIRRNMFNNAWELQTVVYNSIWSVSRCFHVVPKFSWCSCIFFMETRREGRSWRILIKEILKDSCCQKGVMPLCSLWEQISFYLDRNKKKGCPIVLRLVLPYFCFSGVWMYISLCFREMGGCNLFCCTVRQCKRCVYWKKHSQSIRPDFRVSEGTSKVTPSPPPQYKTVVTKCIS